jgi:hypothetical protein
MSFFNGERRAEHLANLWTLFASDQKNPECVSRREKLVPFFIFPGVCPVPPAHTLSPVPSPGAGLSISKHAKGPVMTQVRSRLPCWSALSFLSAPATAILTNPAHARSPLISPPLTEKARRREGTRRPRKVNRPAAYSG